MSDFPEPDWSALPAEILGVIAHRFLIKLKDFILFQSVCQPWRRALVAAEDQRKPPRFRQPFPWLMLPHCRSTNMMSDSAAMVGCKGSDTCRCFYDVTEQQFHHIEVEMPEGFIDNDNKIATCCRGSAFGWVFMLQRAPSLLLFNPLTRGRITLPPITAFPDVEGFRPDKVGYEYRFVSQDGKKLAHGKKVVERNYIAKAALSAEPTVEECVVMVIRLDITLAFCRPNDAVWTLVPHVGDDYGLGPAPRSVAFMDVVFWRGQFYAIDDQMRLYVCDISRPHLSLILQCPTRIFADNFYLLATPDGGNLMVVTRHLIYPEGEDLMGDPRSRRRPNETQLQDGADSYMIDYDDDDDEGETESIAAAARGFRWLTGEFKVYKLNEDVMGWDEVENIDDSAIFLGFNTATWVSARDHPELGLVPNSIYYTDNMTDFHGRGLHPGSDMGIYNLTTRTVHPLYSTSSIHRNPLLIFPFPVWILPSTY